jgi:hypothetical protein
MNFDSLRCENLTSSELSIVPREVPPALFELLELVRRLVEVALTIQPRFAERVDGSLDKRCFRVTILEFNFSPQTTVLFFID